MTHDAAVCLRFVLKVAKYVLRIETPQRVFVTVQQYARDSQRCALCQTDVVAQCKKQIKERNESTNVLARALLDRSVVPASSNTHTAQERGSSVLRSDCVPDRSVPSRSVGGVYGNHHTRERQMTMCRVLSVANKNYGAGTANTQTVIIFITFKVERSFSRITKPPGQAFTVNYERHISHFVM